MFAEQICIVNRYVTEFRAEGRPMQTFTVDTSVETPTNGMLLRIGPGANPRIILREDTFLELGNPAAGSCAVVLWTDATDLVADGRVILIGPDIPQSPASSLPFGQVLLVAGNELTAEDHQAIIQARYVADQIEGYMVKSFSRNIWARVSKDAAAKGFSFAILGRALIALYKSALAKVQAMEVIFITSAREDVLRLSAVATQVRESGAEIVKQRWKAKGYDLDCDLDCRSCHDKDVCDDVRKIAATRLRNERINERVSPLPPDEKSTAQVLVPLLSGRGPG